MNRWKTSTTAVFNLSYHVVWCPKYRRPVLTEDIQTRMLQLLHEKALKLDIEIVEANILPDHVHLFVKTKPIHSPQFVIGQLKGYTSRILRACSKSVIRMLCCYKSAINSQKFFGILNNIAKNFCEFIANFSKQIIRSKILNRL